jgi:hypothetical protein
MENRASQRAHKLFRQEAQKRDGEVAWKEYTAQEEATHRKTAKLRALRPPATIASFVGGGPAFGTGS